MLPLSKIIGTLESNMQPRSVRFEPAYRPSAAHVRSMSLRAGCNADTARILCAMSFGLFQIMGTTLLDLGMQCSPLTYCCNEPLQVAFFEKFCKARGIAFTADQLAQDPALRLKFAQAYNGHGPSAQIYADRIAATIKTLEG